MATRNQTRVIGLAVVLGAVLVSCQGSSTQDDTVSVEKTANGDLMVHPVNHASLRFAFKEKQYYVDPAGKASWHDLPKADVIFITHQHGDHLDPAVIKLVKKSTVIVFANENSVKAAGFGTAIHHGETKKVHDITATAVPAYNITPGRLRFHPIDRADNGYVLVFGGVRVYVAGDTEDIPELKELKDIDIAFLPCNLPYTMDAEQCARAARMFKPKVLYPYHQGRTDPNDVKRALADEKGIEVRVLKLP